MPAAFVDGTPVTAALMNAWVTEMQAEVVAQIAPTGTIWAYGGSAAPTGWLLCNGALVSTTTYATLYGIVGTAYGSGSGTFGLPDLRGRAPIGLGTNADVSTLGNSDGITVSSRTPKHTHKQNIQTLGVDGAVGSQVRLATGSDGNGQAMIIPGNGTGAIVGVQAGVQSGNSGYQVVNYIIKY